MKFNKASSWFPMKPKRFAVIAIILMVSSLIFGWSIGVVHAAAPSAGWIIANNVAIQWKDASGTAQNCLYDDASNNFQIGGTNCNPTFGSQITIANNVAIQWKDSTGTAQKILWTDGSNNVNLQAATTNGIIAFYNFAGTKLIQITESNGAIEFLSTAAARIGATRTGLGNDGSNDLVLNVPPGQVITLGINGVNTINIGSTGITRYAAINTAGWGVPAIYASFSVTGKTGADTNEINYTPPATAGTYCIAGHFNPTTATTYSINFVLTYKDDGGTTRTLNLNANQDGTNTWSTTVANGDATKQDNFYFCFTINNSATAITLSTSGTFTTVTYNWAGFLEQVA